MIERIDNDSLVKINTEKNCGKYDHFERRKPDDIYFLRLISGPNEYFQKTKEEIRDVKEWLERLFECVLARIKHTESQIPFLRKEIVKGIINLSNEIKKKKIFEIHLYHV